MSVAQSTTRSARPGQLVCPMSTLVIGAEVSGIDLREELDAPTVAALSLMQSLNTKLLIFTNQDITDEQRTG